MKPDDLKNSLNSITPDSYMETRLFAEIKDAEKPKKKSGKLFKVAVCTALCCAVLVAGVGIGIPKKAISDSNENIVETGENNNYFVMSVYAAEGENKTPTPIDDKAVTFPDFKLEKRFGADGLELHCSAENGNICMNGENIKTVKIKCETGNLDVWNFDLLHYLRDRGEYYDVIVPYSDEYEHLNVNERLDTFFNHIKNGDYDEYIKGKEIKPYNDYISADEVYDKDDNVIGIGLVSKESYHKIHPRSAMDDWWEFKEYTFENVLNKKDVDNVFSWDYGGAEMLFDNPDLPFSALPHDTISLEVTFNDGSVQNASYDFSFNDNGELVVQRIAD